MAVDALDPGAEGIFPWFPRNLDGSPNYQRAGYRDPALPYEDRLAWQDGVRIDLTSPVTIPTVDPSTLPGGIAQ